MSRLLPGSVHLALVLTSVTRRPGLAFERLFTNFRIASLHMSDMGDSAKYAMFKGIIQIFIWEPNRHLPPGKQMVD